MKDIQTTNTNSKQAVYTVETVEDCRVRLSTEQLLEAGRELAINQAEVHQLEDDFKSVRDEWKSKISALEARITTTAGRISRGYDIKPITCTVTMDSPTQGLKVCRRNDTWEQVWEREMTGEDQQLKLSLDGEPYEIENTDVVGVGAKEGVEY